MTGTETNDRAEAQSKTGYKNPPVKYRWGPGQSGCPSGGKKRKRSSIRTAFADKLTESHLVPRGAKKERLTLKHRIVRGLLENAASGKQQALVTIIKLHEDKEEVDMADTGGVSMTMSYSNAAVCNGYDAMDEEFFQNEERKLAAWKQEDRRCDVSFATLIDRELRRKVPAMLNGEPVMAPIQDVIVATFLKKAFAGDVAIVKLLLKILPEKKVKRPWRSLVLRPTQAELDRLDPKYLPKNLPKTRPEGAPIGGMLGVPHTEVQVAPM